MTGKEFLKAIAIGVEMFPETEMAINSAGSRINLVTQEPGKEVKTIMFEVQILDGACWCRVDKIKQENKAQAIKEAINPSRINSILNNIKEE